MPEETNPAKRTMSEISQVGTYIDILVAIFPTIAGALANHKVTSIWGLLVLTAPLTLTVAFQTYRAASGKIHNPYTFGISSILLLIALSLLSSWIGFGTAIDVGKVVEPHIQIYPNNHQTESSNGMVLIYSFLFELLESYYDLYQPVIFYLSLGCGFYLGIRIADQTKKKRAQVV